MEYTVEESKDHRGVYIAYAVNHEGDGEIYIAEFPGPKSKERAEEYARWKNSELQRAASAA